LICALVPFDSKSVAAVISLDHIGTNTTTVFPERPDCAVQLVSEAAKKATEKGLD
jgi:hypothetical protein